MNKNGLEITAKSSGAAESAKEASAKVPRAEKSAGIHAKTLRRDLGLWGFLIPS